MLPTAPAKKRTTTGHLSACLLLAAVAILLTEALGARARSPLGSSAAAGASAPADSPLLQSRSLVYQGAFRLPLEDFGVATFAYGGTSIAFNPARGSLLVVGHDWYQQVAEISIPAIRKERTANALDTAQLLQPLAEVTEGKMGSVDPGTSNTVKIGGLLPFRGRLYLTAYSYYDGDASQSVSHFVSGMDFNAKGDVRGPFAVGGVGAGFVSGYLGMVPAAWQEALGGPVLNGQCCLSVISRTSYGPSLFTIDPAQQTGTSRLAANPLLYYPEGHQSLGGWGTTSSYFNGSTEVRGVVFPERTRSVLLFGRQGLGAFCYGTGFDCHDSTDDSKGTHAFPYAYYVWAYDAVELAAVKAGQRQPWDLKPYAVWKLDLPIAQPNAHLNGAAYDPATGRIFVSQAFGDGRKPLIHVFTVASGVR